MDSVADSGLAGRRRALTKKSAPRDGGVRWWLASTEGWEVSPWSPVRGVRRQGAPGEDGQSGAVFIFHGSNIGLKCTPGVTSCRPVFVPRSFVITQTSAGEVNENGDRIVDGRALNTQGNIV